MTTEAGPNRSSQKLPSLHRDRLTVTNDPDSSIWKAGVQVEGDVFVEKEYVDYPLEIEKEYAKYLPTTKFAVVERDGQVVGATRLIFYNQKSGFKTLDDIKSQRLYASTAGKVMIDNLDLPLTVEIGTIAASRETRSSPRAAGRVAMALYSMIFAESVSRGCHQAIASFDQDYLNRFRQSFGNGVKDLGPPSEYMGSPTIPVCMDMDEMYGHMGSTPGNIEAINGFANIIQHD